MDADQACQIIRCTPAEYRRLSALNLDVPPASKWYDELAVGNRVIFICLQNGVYRAEGALVLAHPDPDYCIPGQRAYLSGLVVQREYRSQGIGSRLLAHIIAYARELGLAEVSLGVNCDNAAALRLYQRFGFARVICEAEDQDGKYVKLLRVASPDRGG
ncbi:MAG: GNAT family N-acetyltransferase [Anaerolineae bacterium]